MKEVDFSKFKEVYLIMKKCSIDNDYVPLYAVSTKEQAEKECNHLLDLYDDLVFEYLVKYQKINLYE